MTVDEIEATINEGSMTYGPVQVVFIDYLGLIEGRGDEYEHLSHVAKALKNIAKRTGAVMVYLHQLSRKGEDGTKPVTLEMARGSGVIEESVDYLIGAWRPEGTDSPEFAAAILKNRHGRLGDALLYLNPRTLSLTEREEVPVEVIYPETTSGREEVSEAFDWGNDNGEDPFSV
jgi:replicative DNA helicase